MISIVFTLLKEIIFSIAGKVLLKSVAERFATRLVIFGLEKLKSYSSNEVVDATVVDVITLLKGNKLKVIDELPINSDNITDK